MSAFTLTTTELWVAIAAAASTLTLVGIVAWQNWAERRDRLESAPGVQDRLEAHNRGGKR